MRDPRQWRFPLDVRERAVRLVRQHQDERASLWAAIGCIAGKIGCTPETARCWGRRAERDGGQRAGPKSEERDRIKALERKRCPTPMHNQAINAALLSPSTRHELVDAALRPPASTPTPRHRWWHQCLSLRSPSLHLGEGSLLDNERAGVRRVVGQRLRTIGGYAARSPRAGQGRGRPMPVRHRRVALLAAHRPATQPRHLGRCSV
jgi:transposase